jgi:hypothetical protein
MGKNIAILNWPRPLMRRGVESNEETDRAEPISIVIHICMETTQRISPYSYLYLKLAKCHAFLIFVFCIFFYKIGRLELVQSGGWVSVSHPPIGEGAGGGERSRRMNMVQIMYTYVCKCKNDTC